MSAATTPEGVSITQQERLADPDAVRGVAARARERDGVAPLGEAFELALDEGGHHLLARSGDTLLGYARLADDGSAEVVVDPPARGRGVGRALVEALLAADPEVRVWAHGDLPAARTLAARLDLQVARELLVLARPLTAEDATAPPLPAGLRARPFVPGADDAELLAVNAAAFAHHPEQGSLDQAGLEQRMALPWFDPEGLILLVEGEGDGRTDGEEVVGFHWTKVEGGVGEVYVVGVRPDHQGRGLAGPLTRLGLSHLAGRGLTEVELYVEGDNTPALATYTREGFARRDVHVMYSRVVHG